MSVTDGSATLVENTDYTVSYSNNTNVGTATVTVTGIGNYEGTKDKTFTIEYESISLNAAKSVSISTAGAKRYFRFVPSADMTVTFYSTGSVDTYGHLYDANLNQLTYNDDGGEGTNFKINYDLTAGTTYLFACRLYSSGSTGSFDVKLEQQNNQTPKPAFTWGQDNWRFNNSGSNFGSTYYINSTYYNKLLSGLNRLEADQVKNGLRGAWQGSCYGMAVTSILGYEGILNPAAYTGGATCINDISSPPSNTVKSLINYYFAVQYTDQIQQKSIRAIYASETSKINQLLTCLSDDSPTLLCYYWPPTYNAVSETWNYSGHAVVAYDVVDTVGTTNGFSYNKKVLVYDNRLTGFADNRCIYINTDNDSWYLPYDGLSSNNGGKLGLITDSMTDINYHGYIDGNDNISIGEFISMLKTTEVSSEISWSKFDYTDSIFTYNAVDDEDIIYFSPITDVSSSNSFFNIGLKDSESGYSMRIEKPQQQDISMRYENALIEIKTSNSDHIAFLPNGFSYLEGDGTDYSINLKFNDGYFYTDWYNISVTGKSVDKASLTPKDNGYVLEATNLNNVVIDAKNDTHYASKTISTNFKKVFIYEKDENTIGLKVDTDGNGTYETELPSSQSAYQTGDTNLDNTINIRDVTAMQRYLADLETFTNEQITLADTNGDGTVDIQDATHLQKYLAEYDVILGKV